MIGSHSQVQNLVSSLSMNPQVLNLVSSLSMNLNLQMETKGRKETKFRTWEMDEGRGSLLKRKETKFRTWKGGGGGGGGIERPPLTRKLNLVLGRGGWGGKILNGPHSEVLHLVSSLSINPAPPSMS